jgi:hypothetical protein
MSVTGVSQSQKGRARRFEPITGGERRMTAAVMDYQQGSWICITIQLTGICMFVIIKSNNAAVMDYQKGSYMCTTIQVTGISMFMMMMIIPAYQRR